ncbi:hypothetical protein ACE1AT_04795 [Pelatocladus sp. BLCC-F211]|uniref:hypothetical protein n=1 Tax=Pelatocladus sp. BLCC-F211 TaxID=3342752 RepID=UPI0035B8CABB
MIDPTIQFVLQNSNGHFYAKNSDRPVGLLETASRFSTFDLAMQHKENFKKQNEATEIYARPVHLTIALLD